MKHARHRAPRRGLRRVAVAGTAVLAPLMAAVPAAGASPLTDIVNTGSAAASHIGNIALSGVAADAVSDALGAATAAAGFEAPQAGGTRPSAVSEGQRIVDAARSQIGTPYVWGGTGPGGFDCSGLTSWSYQQVGKSIPRTSQAQANGGAPVATPQLGDIVVFYPGATHVGIYSGGGNVIHAPQAGQNVHETSVSYMPVHSHVRF